MKRRDIPNVITVLRVILVVPIIWLILEREFGLALILFFIAGLSDGLDGYLAKRNQWESRLGSILDPLADKLLLISSYVALGWLEDLPMWLVAAVLIRDIVIVVGALIYHVAIGQYDMSPSIMSKINTFMQILLVFSVVFSLGLYALPAGLINILIYMVLLTTVVSGIHYVYVWGKRAVAKKKQ